MRSQSRLSSLLVVVVTLLALHSQTVQACSADSFIKNCTGAVSEIEAFKASLAGGAGAAAAAAGSNINGNSFSLSSVTKDSAAADLQGASYCEQQLSQCQAQCTKPSDRAQLQRCKKEIPPNIERCKQSAANLAKDSGSAGDSGNQSNGMPPMPPQSPADASTPPAPPTDSYATPATAPASSAPAPATVNFQASCSGENAYVLDQCSSQLLKECEGRFKSSELCEKFSHRYCDPSASVKSSQASAGALPAGASKGSAYCMAYQGDDFCTKTAGSESCPSCSKKPQSAGENPSDVCMGDPAFSNPALAKAIAGSAASGGGGSSGGTGSGGNAQLTDAISAESQVSSLPKLSGLDSGSGGGGASAGGGSASLGVGDSSLHDKTDSFGLGVSSTRIAATDISRKPQSLFEISSEVIMHKCLKGQLLRCGSK